MVPAITGIYETKITRHLDASVDIYDLLQEAIHGALLDAQLKLSDIDGLGVICFQMSPDHAADLTWRMGMSCRWLIEAAHGGSSSVNTLGHAVRALEAGDASAILVVGGGTGRRAGTATRLAYNRARRDQLSPLGYTGPNSIFAMLTQRQMDQFGLTKEDYGHLVIGQRAWAVDNPIAVYRDPLTMEAYLNAPMVAEPLGLFDCPPTSAGASAFILTDAKRCPSTHKPIKVKAFRQSYNYDNQEGTGTRTGLSKYADSLWNEVGAGPEALDLACFYDDYPAMVFAQLNDLKIIPNDDIKGFVRDKLSPKDRSKRFPVNTSGGLLSAGQVGGSGAMLATMEVTRQLMHRAGPRQVPNARLGVGTGYGQVLYRYGAAVGAVVLERME